MSRFKSRREPAQRQSRQQESRGRERRSGGSEIWIHGLHAVAAALLNPERRPKRLLLTQEAFEALQQVLADTPHSYNFV